MAGINLAGAIGMTGKRESVLSDLPAYIKDTGDYLAARNEQRRKEEAAKKAKEQEWENNQQENFSKNVSANLGSRVQGFNEKYEKYAQNEMAKAYTAHLNPNLTLNQKQKAREEAHNNIAKAKSIYLNAEEDVDKKINPIVNDDKFASQQAVDYIYGKRPTVSSEVTNTQPVEFLVEKPATAPMLGATGKESRKVTTTHNKPLYEMNHEEIAKDYETGVAAKVLPMVKLHETSLDKIAVEAVPSKPDFIKITKENINGVDKVTKTINHEGMVNAVESIYTNIITQSGKEATRMYNKLHQDAYIASKDNKNITNEQDREAFMDDYIKEHALGAAKTWVDTEYKNQEMANENIDRTANNTTNNYYQNGIIPTPLAKTPKEQTQVKVIQEFDNNIETLKGNNRDYQYEIESTTEPISKERKAELESRIAKNNKAIENYEKASKINVVGRPAFVHMTNTANIRLKDNKGNAVDGQVVSPLITDKGELYMEVQEVVNGNNISHAVPLTIDNEQILLNNAGDNKNVLKAEIDQARADALKVKSSRQATPTKKEAPAYGTRNDGVTQKGTGYFGKLKMKDGSNKVATELTISPKVNGKYMDIPSLVPTLTEEEKNWLLTNGMKGDDVWEQPIAKTIEKKAIAHAEKRIKEGKSVFANDGVAPKKTESSKIIPKGKVR